MRVDKLGLINFRNYERLSLDFTHNINIFIGENAQGKTNILEAIYLGALGRSHRTADDDDLIFWEQSNCGVDINFTRQGLGNKLGFRLTRGQNKAILFNDYTIKPREVIGSLNAVLFSPEDLWLIKGAPALRRRFLDIEISQAVPAYYRQLLQYNRIISQRNNLLKKIKERKAVADQLDAWDEQAALAAVYMVNKRTEAIKKLAMIANLMHRKITASRENLALSYYTAGCGEMLPNDLHSWYREQLLATRDGDINRGSTAVGPHRDDLILKVNDKDLRNFGSQGQQRTSILALKLAELEFLMSETGEYPVLLLDDVMSELDSRRREQLLLFIRDRIQTFVTATDQHAFPDTISGRYYQVTAGKVAE